MLTPKLKNIILAVLMTLVLFEIGSVILYSIKYKEFPKQYEELFEKWEGWLVVIVSILAGAGSWHLLSK